MALRSHAKNEPPPTLASRQRGASLPPGRERHAWMDWAKGICMVAVVTMYTHTHVTLALGQPSWMQGWVDFAQPFRMPDFFFISGLLLSKVIDRPWRVYLDNKLVHYLYFFVLWSLLYFALRVAIGHAGEDGPAIGREFVRVMTHSPFAMLWFVQMLAFYFVLTKLVRRVPWPWVLALAALWHLLPVDTPWSQLNRAGERYVFFFAGYALAHHVFAFTRWTVQHRGVALAGVVGWAALNAAMVFGGASTNSGMSLLLGLLGAFAVIAVAALLESAHWMDGLRHCGEHSLPIYVGFFMPMSVLTNLYLFGAARHGLPAVDPGWFSIALAAASIGAALLAARWSRGTWLGWLYERPRWARLVPSQGPGPPRQPTLRPRRGLHRRPTPASTQANTQATTQANPQR